MSSGKGSDATQIRHTQIRHSTPKPAQERRQPRWHTGMQFCWLLLRLYLLLNAAWRSPVTQTLTHSAGQHKYGTCACCADAPVRSWRGALRPHATGTAPSRAHFFSLTASPSAAASSGASPPPISAASAASSSGAERVSAGAHEAMEVAVLASRSQSSWGERAEEP